MKKIMGGIGREVVTKMIIRNLLNIQMDQDDSNDDDGNYRYY